MKKLMNIFIYLCLVAIMFMGGMVTSYASDTHTIDKLECDNTITNKSLQDCNEKFDFESFFKSAEIVDYDLSGVSFQLKEEKAGQNVSTTVKVVPNDTIQALEFIEEAKAEMYYKSSGNNRASGSNYRYKWDGTVTAKVWTRIYFTEVVYNGKDYVKLTKVKGGVYSSTSPTGSHVGDHIYINDNDLTIGQTGITTNGYRTQTRNFNFSNSVRSFTKYPYSSWLPVANVPQSTIGAFYSVEFRGRGQTWTVNLSNNIY